MATYQVRTSRGAWFRWDFRVHRADDGRLVGVGWADTMWGVRRKATRIAKQDTEHYDFEVTV